MSLWPTLKEFSTLRINVICIQNSDLCSFSHLFANRILFGLSFLDTIKKEAVESVYEEDTGDCIKLPLFYCRNNNLV